MDPGRKRAGNAGGDAGVGETNGDCDEAAAADTFVVTAEPGIYLPGVGGVRIEDDVLVTSRGRRVLSDLPKDLESAVV